MEADASPPEWSGKASGMADGRARAQHPAPYLDVLTIHSRRLLHKMHEEIAAKERAGCLLRSDARADGHDPNAEDDVARLEELMASVRLLLEPVYLPDLSHTGIAAESVGKPPQGDDVLLFYPTGAKNANMREFVREMLDKHQLLRDAKSTADLNDAEPSSFSSPSLVASASTPAITTASKAKAVASTKRRARKPAAHSPVKAAMSPGALLDRKLTRQAKDVIAALRVNSSKINELIAK